MSMLNTISDFSTAPAATRRMVRVLVREFARLIKNSIAAVIAQRERQATLTILRKLSDRELKDIGLYRNEIGPGLAEAAKTRLMSQGVRHS
jgi:uncharacterized protein YjiS (DUF1127 family)